MFVVDMVENKDNEVQLGLVVDIYKAMVVYVVDLQVVFFVYVI